MNHSIMDVDLGSSRLSAGEKIRIEESHKYSTPQRDELWEAAGLVPQATHGNTADDYRKCILKHLSHKTVSFTEILR